MAQIHDEGAEKCGNFILDQIRKNNESFRQVFSPSLHRIGDFDWPRPDFVCMDDKNNSTYALEYKPPMQSKREYVCGLGQSITYLQHHTYSGLILPVQSDDGFSISNFMFDVMNTEPLKDSPNSLYVYDSDYNVRLLKPINRLRSSFANKSAQELDKTFWCWWRDMSHYEVFTLLKLSFEFGDKPGDIYTDCIFPKFWGMVTSGQIKDFDGNFRSVKDSSMSSYKQNYRIPFEQLGLWTSKEGHLSTLGFKLLSIGMQWGADSSNFRDALAYLILTEGKHLDLIHTISRIQEEQKGFIPAKSKDFLQFLDEQLTSLGMIGKRKPTAITSNAKASYVRDEPKIWNKFGLVKQRSVNRYFFERSGYHFDWERITAILRNGGIDL